MKREFLDETFDPASACLRVRAMTGLSFLVVFISGVVAGAMALSGDAPRASWLKGLGSALAPALGLLIVHTIWLGARVRGYRLVGDVLIVDRFLHKPRFTLAGLASVEPDRAAMSGARKIVGNDGLGAIAGRFHSGKLGPFRAYVTDPAHAVVLRWPDHVLVISPDRDFEFAEAVRPRAGLKN